MKKRIMLLILFLNIETLCIYAFPVTISKINFIAASEDVTIAVEEEKFTDSLIEATKDKDPEGLISLSKLPETRDLRKIEIRSSLDAAEAVQIFNITYLLYGYVEKTNKYYSAEIRLFEADSKSDRKIFFAKRGLEEYEELINELSAKFIDYLFKQLGLQQQEELRQADFGGIAVSIGIGYWFPFGQWGEALDGWFTVESGAQLIPQAPLYKRRNYTFYPALGVFLSYALGGSEREYLQATFHSFDLRVAAELYTELYFNHAILVGLGPEFHLDLLSQKKLYTAKYYETRLAFSLFAELGYEYWFGEKKQIAVGLNNRFDCAFYATPFFDYKVTLYSKLRIPLKESGGKQ